jgi:hypothetical protein
MRKILTILSILFFLSSCTKQAIQRNSDASELNGKVKPNIYQGPCPYPCNDYRCQYYSEPNPDCQLEDPPPTGRSRICGSEFAQFNLQGKTFSAVVDSAGSWHNEFLTALLAKMEQQNVNLYTDTIQSFLKNNTIAFFATKGINPASSSIPNIDLSDSTWPISNYSTTAQSILSNLKALIDNYVESEHSSFISECNSLETQALNLPNDNEAIAVGMAVSGTIHSFNYWKDNLTFWQNYLTYIPDDSTIANRQAPCNVNLRHVGGADGKGFVSGAVGGIEGGPALMFASGTVVGGASSVYNILGQALTCQPGIVGRVSRWVASWF